MAHSTARHPSATRGIAALALAFMLIATGPRPAAAQPDLVTILSAVVAVEASIPDDARTAAILGDQRLGTGIVIDGAGLVVTIGYLILEASDAWVRTGGGQRVAADIVAYDHDTGFGLLRARAPLDKVVPMALGDSEALVVGTPAVIASFGGPGVLQPVVTVSRRDFAGYWEYLLENAIFTSPPYRLFGGAALLFVGLVAGYYLAFQGNRTIGFAAPGMDQTDLLTHDDVAISNVRFVDSDLSDGMLEIGFEAVRPVQIRGTVDDPGIQRVLTFTVLNEQNPGVRLRALNAVSASEDLHSEQEIKDALVTALKTDANAGVRGEAFNALTRYPFDAEIRDAMIHTLVFDENPALRINAINRLQEQVPASYDENLERVLRASMVSDENAYIRTKARTVLSNLSAP